MHTMYENVMYVPVVPIDETNFMWVLKNNVIYNYNFEGGKTAMYDLCSL